MSEALWPQAEPGTRWVLRLPNWVGDAILVLPALRSLPRDEQRFLAVAHPRVAGLYRGLGSWLEVIAAGGAAAPWRARGRMRAFRPHRALVFTEASSGRLLAWLSGAGLRLGRSKGPARPLLTHSLPPASRAIPAWRGHLELALAAGGEAPLRADFRIAVDVEAVAKADALLAGARGFVALAPGAAYGPAKRWPLESFAALARALRERGRAVVVVGGPDERALGSALAETGALDLTGRTGMMEAVAVLSRAALLVTNDSGALHLARAAGTPVVALFGSSSPAWTGPEADEGDLLRFPVPCSPCFRRRCPLTGDAHLACLRGITVDVVETAVERRLEAAP